MPGRHIHARSNEDIGISAESRFRRPNEPIFNRTTVDGDLKIRRADSVFAGRNGFDGVATGAQLAGQRLDIFGVSGDDTCDWHEILGA